MTQFSFEVPINHLNDFEEDQDFHFALSFLAEENDLYAKWHTKQEKPVWLDNSYNEKMVADHPSNLVRLAKKVFADYIICPDDPTWHVDKIIESYIDTCKYTNSLLPTPVVVVNSEHMLNTVRLRTNVNSFAIPYRARANYSLDQLQWTQNHHFLGLLNVDELIRYKPPSCDTSMPIKLAMQGIMLDEWIASGCPHIHTKDLPDFFTYTMNMGEIGLAKANIQMLKEMVND